VLGHEVGLGVELDHGAGLAALAVTDVDGDEALGGGAALALGDALEALDADQLHGLGLVAVRLVERLLDVEHARAGGLADLLDVCCRVVGHVPLPCGEMLREGEAGAPPGRGPGTVVPFPGPEGHSAAGASEDFSSVTASAAASAAGALSAAWAGASAEMPAGASAVSAASAATDSSAGAPCCWTSDCLSSSCSHSASGSASTAETFFSPPADLAWRSCRPAATASAITRVSSVTERIASSLPGIG